VHTYEYDHLEQFDEWKGVYKVAEAYVHRRPDEAVVFRIVVVASPHDLKDGVTTERAIAAGRDVLHRRLREFTERLDFVVVGRPKTYVLTWNGREERVI
jgi:hypothetical protein